MDEQRWEDIRRYFWILGRLRPSLSSESDGGPGSEADRLVEVLDDLMPFSGLKRQSVVKLLSPSLTYPYNFLPKFPSVSLLTSSTFISGPIGIE